MPARILIRDNLPIADGIQGDNDARVALSGQIAWGRRRFVQRTALLSPDLDTAVAI